MYLERLEVEGFRNCPKSVTFDPSLTLLIGENNSGKTNVVDALRGLLQNEFGSRRSLDIADFAHDGTGASQVSDLRIAATFDGLSIEERGRMSTALAPSAGAGKARIGLSASISPEERVEPALFGGDLDNPDVELRAFSVAQHTYLPPLRDAESDLLPGRSNRLARLLTVLTPDEADRSRLEKLAADANQKLEGDPAIQGATQAVQSVLDQMTGPTLKQQSRVAFAESRFEALIRNLVALLGERQARDLAESGLGYQNILYMAVLLAHLSRIEEVPLRILLVEEPEAHLHPQLQDLLLRYLQDNAVAGRQVIVTSNSPQFAAAAELQRVVALTRPRQQVRCEAYRLAAFDLDERERAHIRRFLDVTKAALFFARGVILVEGVSEQLLLPQLARIVGRNLADAGVAVVNIGGVAFRQFAKLFAEGALPIPCAIVTDGDADPDDPNLEPSARAKAIAELRGGQVEVFTADVTLEWDLGRAAPTDKRLIDALAAVHPQTAAGLSDDAADDRAWATEFRDAVGRSKAEVAQQLAAALEQSDDEIAVPEYLRRAILFVTPDEADEPGEDEEAEPEGNDGSGEG